MFTIMHESLGISLKTKAAQSYHCVMASHRDNLILLEMLEEKKNFGVKTVITISH